MGNEEKAVEYFKSNYAGFLEDLKGLVRIPSISAAGFDRKNLVDSAEAIAVLAKAAGLLSVEILEVNGSHPYIYGEWLGQKGAPTVLLYAHHDVQPTGEIDKWETAPFEPRELDERLFGRGVADDKAGVVATLASIASYLKSTGGLPLNVKVIFEGEEEIGSDNLENLINEYRDKLFADFIVLSDTDNYDIGIPAVTTQLRGIVYCNVTVSALSQPLHSGAFGGPIPDPVQSLAKLIAKLSDEDGKMTIPHIYDDVAELSKEDKESLRSLPFDIEMFRHHSCLLDGVSLIGEKDFTPNEQIWFRPSLSVNAIQASSREQVSNIIVDCAWARISIRIVPNMDPEKTLNQLVKFLKDNAPKGVILDVKPFTSVPWWKTDTKHMAFGALKDALTKGYGRDPVFIGCGGSIGFVEPFTKALNGAPALLIGVEDPHTNAHSWNESLYLPDWKKCIISLIHLFENLSKIS
ncbi:MAG: M20/M25/M40 family metallo-hydrolase [Candidatus Vogelbacteria bacterium]|nr:M20/M25/M40 family metallo-hydrolase [Candidatus Vogelbacteria bacterium]